MRALARASDAIAPSDSFEIKKTGITNNAKRVPTLVGDFLAGSGSQTAFKGERDYSATRKSGSEPVGGGPKGIFQAEAAGKFPQVESDSWSNPRGMVHGRATSRFKRALASQ
jgi:hypothetical protein